MNEFLLINVLSFVIFTGVASANLFTTIGDAKNIGEIFKKSPVDLILVAALYSILLILLLLLLIPITRGKILTLLGESFLMTAIIAFCGIFYFAYSLIIRNKGPLMAFLNILSLVVSFFTTWANFIMSI